MDPTPDDLAIRSASSLLLTLVLAVSPAFGAQAQVTSPASRNPSAVYPGYAIKPHHEQFGYCIAVGGDADGDGVSDFAIGEPGWNECGLNTGAVVLYSGSTQRVLRRWAGLVENQYFGISASFVGDRNRDKCADIAIGSLFGNVVRVYSGKTGEELQRIVGPESDEASWFGSCVTAVGDLDGDGKTELAIGAPRHRGAGFVEILAGDDGTPLLVIGDKDPDGPWDRFRTSYLGRVIVPLGDVNGDGVSDIAVGAPGQARLGFGNPDANETAPVPRVLVVSGKTRRTLFERTGDKPRSGFGTALTAIDDFDGDGHPDLAAGCSREESPDGRLGAVHILSGIDGRDLSVVYGNLAANSEFGYAVVQIDDIDGDGARDLAVGDPMPGTCTESGGRVVLVSTRTGKALRSITRGDPGPTVSDFGFSLAFQSAQLGSVSGKLFVGANCRFWGGYAGCFSPSGDVAHDFGPWN